jgi:SPP1 gp7 family putative phage head morphogenesis protein
MKNNFPLHLENFMADIYVSVIKIVNKRLKKLITAYKNDPIIKEVQRILKTDSFKMPDPNITNNIKIYQASLRTDSLRNEIEKFLYSKEALTDADIAELESKFGRLDTALKRYSANTLNNQIDRMKAELKNKKQYKFALEQSLDAPEIMNIRSSFLAENLRLAEMLGNEYMAEIGQSAFNAFLEGRSLKDLVDEFQDITDVQESRAEFWGRDQLGDAYAEYTQEMHKSAGIERYIWRTTGDNHVRGVDPKDKTSHVQLNGKIFNWTDGAIAIPDAFSKPDARHPGEDYQCRCIADPTENEETDMEEFE